MIEIGRRLVDCKAKVGHGGWLPWLESEFGWTDKTAENFINVHKLAGKFENISNLDIPISGLYLLAAPAADEVRDAVIARAEAGEAMSVEDIRRAIDKLPDFGRLARASSAPPRGIRPHPPRASHRQRRSPPSLGMAAAGTLAPLHPCAPHRREILAVMQTIIRIRPSSFPAPANCRLSDGTRGRSLHRGRCSRGRPA